MQNIIIEKLKGCSFIIQNEYFNSYVELVLSAKAQTGYKELHHIFCKSFSKALVEPINNSSENLVSLLFKDHCKAHWLLYKCTIGEQQKAMANAFISMISFKNRKNILELGLTEADYNELQKHIEAIKVDSTLNYWTDSDEQFLIDNYASKGQRYCAEKLNRSLKAISSRAVDLGLTMDKWWSKEELAWLADNYIKLGKTACAEYLKRSEGSVRTKASALGLTKSTIYSEEEKQFLKDNYQKYGDLYCAKVLGRCADAIRAYANRTLKLHRLPQGRPIYCPELDQVFESIKDASIKLNMSDGNICGIVNGRIESSKGLHFIEVDKEKFYAERESKN